MKKCAYLFLMFAYLFIIAGLAGCGDKCSGCPKDVELSDVMEQRIPYQAGQITRFANAFGDTIVLNCLERVYSQEERFAMERPESECCPSYFVENVHVKMSGSSSSFLNIRTDNNGGYIIRISANLEGKDYSGEYFSNKLDSIVLSNKAFYNVLTMEKDNQEIFMFIGLDNGIVGFTINGEEWALVE
ncbi:MAG: hypothetical protein IT258_12655 [Saprospiraceae bacterium]|nr:hypothetical protein [Saprospiraceae bacterium]